METSFEDMAYLYDGTLEGLLTAVFESYARHEIVRDIVPENRYEPRLGQFSHVVETDFQKADRVREGVTRAVGPLAFTAIMKASTCEDYDMGIKVHRFIRYAMARPEQLRSSPILGELANPVVDDLVKLVKHAGNESERIRQFARFSHLENGVWFARVRPNASVVPLVMGHFAARFNIQPFILYDERHDVAGVYDGHGWKLVRGEVVNVPNATDHDILMQEAWKRFYDSVSIDARYNPELRRQFLPVRWWGTLTEMQPRRAGIGENRVVVA